MSQTHTTIGIKKHKKTQDAANKSLIGAGGSCFIVHSSNTQKKKFKDDSNQSTNNNNEKPYGRAVNWNYRKSRHNETATTYACVDNFLAQSTMCNISSH